MAKVAVIGAGSWGTALAKVLHTNGSQVTVWSIVEAEIAMLRERHEHAVPARESHPGVSFSLIRGMRYFVGKHIPSDGHEVFNVLRCLRLNFSKKTPTFPYIREVGKAG